MVISQSNICRSALNSTNICDRLHLAWSLFIQGPFEHLGFGHIELDYENNYLSEAERSRVQTEQRAKSTGHVLFTFSSFIVLRKMLGENEGGSKGRALLDAV